MAKKEPSPISHSDEFCNFAVFNQKTSQFMPRRARKRSNIGLYHVMLRGINRDSIFHDEMDYSKMLKTLMLVSSPTEHDGQVIDEGCAIHAYCLMTNHMHLLIEERSESIERTMKRIGVTYVSYYNKKYERLGPLFQGRFRSEPVDDPAYFIKLMAYIHLNPVKACLVSSPADYPWSSWTEYMSDTIDRSMTICDFRYPFPGMDFELLRQTMAHNNELKAFVPFGGVDRRLTDAEAVQVATQVLPDGVEVNNVVSLPRDQRIAIVQRFYQFGLNFSQISRLTGVSASTVRRFIESGNGDTKC